jgi:hypothetical protein
MERVAADSPDSGWFVGCGYDSHDHQRSDHLERVSVYEAMRQNPRALAFLAVPSGTLLEADDQAIHLYYAGALLEPKPKSYIQKLLARSVG